ncbi:MAG: ABC transporter ATP-binding protein, partial [Hyphomicrobiales bacterium]|nr:ABC transporter ATP-binding protein [Hyphomicrobiales bacterium]
RLVGGGDRPFRLLSFVKVVEAAESGDAEGPPVSENATLRDALADLLWRGAQSLPVTATDGASRGRITLPAILARAGHAP